MHWPHRICAHSFVSISPKWSPKHSVTMSFLPTFMQQTNSELYTPATHPNYYSLYMNGTENLKCHSNAMAALYIHPSIHTQCTKTAKSWYCSCLNYYRNCVRFSGKFQYEIAGNSTHHYDQKTLSVITLQLLVHSIVVHLVAFGSSRHPTTTFFFWMLLVKHSIYAVQCTLCLNYQIT